MPALKFHSSAPVEPHSARQLDANDAGTTVDPRSGQEQGHSVPTCPPCHRDHCGSGPDEGGPRPPLDPVGRHVTKPAAAQLPKGPRARVVSLRRGAASQARAESPKTVRLQSRRASPDPEQPEPATSESARPEETGPSPQGPGCGAVRVAQAAGPGAGATSRAARAGITRRRRGVAAERRRAGVRAGPSRPRSALRPAHAGQCREQSSICPWLTVSLYR